MMTYVQQLRENFYVLGKNFPSNDQILTQVLFALLAREHVFWFSGPGRAKSLMSTSIFGMFDESAPTFSLQITKETTREDMFGNIIADELMKSGREVYNLEGGIVEAVFAFLDEFMDGSDYVLRGVNNVLNEREFKTMGMGIVPAPLHTAIATSNYMRMTPALQAVLDRFMCKAYLRGIDGLGDSLRASGTYLDYSGKRLSLPVLPYDGLRQLSDIVMASEADGGIVVSPGMRLLHVLLVGEFQRRRLVAARAAWHAKNADIAEEPLDMELGVPEVTPRTLGKLFDFSRASAVLHGRNEVHVVDQKALMYGLLTIGDESGDEVLWAQVCSDLLDGMTGRRLHLLEELGKLADMVAQLTAERSQTTNAQLMVGGTMVAASSLTAQQIKAALRGARHMALDLAVSQIELDIKKLSTPVIGFDLLKGW